MSGPLSGSPQHRARPRRVRRGASGMPAVGVDIGGTKVLAAVVDEEGRVLDTEVARTPEAVTVPSVTEARDAIAEAVQALVERHGRCTVGVGAAGFVDAAEQRVRFAPHLPWRDEPLARSLSERLGSRVVGDVLVVNDANAALWAEHRFGTASLAANALMLTLGTGIGGALLLDHRPYRGHNGMAGEFGHMRVVPEGRPCECGGHGCWEQYCSGRALVRAAQEAGSLLAGPELTTAAQSGDPAARTAYDAIGRWLGIGIANLVAAFDPELVVIGGGLSAAGELLLAPARAALAETLVGAGHREEPRLATAALGPLAGAVGAADLSRSRAGGRPRRRPGAGVRRTPRP